MIELDSIGLKNIVYFKDTTLDITPGLNVVRGLNKNSNNKNQNNGAGKSLLFSPIPNVLKGSPPIASRKKAKKDILGAKSCASLSLTTHDKRKLQIFQYANEYKIIENGVDLEISTQTKAEAFVQEAFPLNTEEFYSTVYLTSLIPLSFQYCTPVDRLKYIGNLFRLNDYDVLRKHFSLKLREIKDCETEYRTLLLEQEKYYEQLQKKTFSDEDQLLLDGCNTKIETTKNKLTAVQDNLLKYGKMGVVHNQLLNLNAIVKNHTEESVSSKLKELYSIKKQCEQYDKFIIQYKSYKKSLSSIKEKYDAIVVDGNLDELNKLLSFYGEKYEHYQEALSEYNNSKREHAQYSQLRKEYTQELSEYDFDIVKYDVTENIVHAKSLLKLKNLIHDHEEGTISCPTCATNLKVDELKKIVKKAQKEYDKYSAMAEAQKLAVKLESLVEPEYNISGHEFALVQYEEAKNIIDDTKPKIKLLSQKRDYKEALESIQRPVEVDEPEYESEVIDKLIKKYTKIQEALDDTAKLLEEHDYDDEYDSEIESKLRTKYENLSSILDNAHKKSKELENARAEYKLTLRNKFEVEAKLTVLQETIQSKRIVESLVGAYGAKGLKINAINNIVQTMEESLNNYANFIFNEKFSFELATDSTGISVVVHRKNGVMSDVRNLSGAESDCFRLLFLTSLLPMLPNDRRTNFIVLDEPDSHMDSVSREKFITDFVPHLCSVIPSVYIMTPNDDTYVDANNMIVIKEKGVSILTQDFTRL